MRAILLFFVFILLFNPLYSQSDKFHCILLDVNENPITNANIKINKANFGCTSNKLGIFSFPTNFLPAELQISHIGFQTKNITLSTSNICDSIFMIILNKKIHVFKEVEILDKKTKLISKRENRWDMIDYCINNNRVQVLYMKGTKRKVKFISLSDNTIFEKPLNIKAHEITTDHLGNSFVLSNENAAQFILIENDSIYFFPSTNIEYFEENIQPIIGKIDEYIIFKSLGMHNQEINYWSGNKDTRYLINTIFSKDRYAFAQGVLDEKYELLKKYGEINDMGTLSTSDLKIARRIKLLNWTYSLIGTIPEYSPAFIKQDTVFVFDHVNSSIFKYNVYGKLLDSVKIDYHKNKQWKKRIIYDKKQQLFYAKILRNKRISLYLIDTKSGNISFACEISGTVFPEKLMVYDGKIYFISFDIYHRKILIQQKIK